MADFLVRNSLNPSKVVLCGITYRQVVPKGNEGEAIWVVEIATEEPDINGDSIAPEILNLTNLSYLEEEITAAVERISAKIDWSPFITDIWAPYVESIFPADYEVALETSVEILLKERLPAAGIDIDSISITVNDFDVTSESEITGDPYEYKIKWSPFMRVQAEY